MVHSFVVPDTAQAFNSEKIAKFYGLKQQLKPFVWQTV